MNSSIAPRALSWLVAATVFVAVAVGGAGAATGDLVDGTESETLVDGLENDTAETTDEVDETTNDTTDLVDETGNDTTDLAGDATNETTGAVGETVNDTVETIDETGDTLGDVGTVDVDANLEALAVEADAATVGNASSGESDASGPDRPGDGTNGTKTAADAALVGLLGAITAAGAGASGSAGAGASAGSTAADWRAPLRRALDRLRWSPLGAFRYSRYDDSDPLENDRRRAIYATIEDAPGCYLSEVGERSGVPVSTVRHHVRVLEAENVVTSVKVAGKRRYFPVGDDDGAELRAALAEPAKRAVLESLSDLERASNGRLADELGRDPSTVSHHLAALSEAGLVVRERDGRTVVNELAPDAEAALADDEGASDVDSETEASVRYPADD